MTKDSIAASEIARGIFEAPYLHRGNSPMEGAVTAAMETRSILERFGRDHFVINRRFQVVFKGTSAECQEYIESRHSDWEPLAVFEPVLVYSERKESHTRTLVSKKRSAKRR